MFYGPNKIRSKFIKSGNFSSVTELANKVVEACDNDSYINSFVLSHEEFQDFIDGLLKETNTLNITELGKPKTSIAIVEENIEKVDDKIVNFIFFLINNFAKLSSKYLNFSRLKRYFSCCSRKLKINFFFNLKNSR